MDSYLRNIYIVCGVLVVAILIVAVYPHAKRQWKQAHGEDIIVPVSMRTEPVEVQYNYALELGYVVYLDGKSVEPATINASFYDIAFDYDGMKVFLTKKVN